mmetsp:Transcript_12648/g.26118  ORF Transcript_12648/g.26118 Transcript_12648/m.26118 type:complete len:579 (+) Transcript_12648:210-1946(+)
MTKLSIVGNALIGAIVVIIGVDAASGVKRISPARNSNASEDSISARINDPELLEYFQIAGHTRQLSEGEDEDEGEGEGEDEDDGVSEDEYMQYHNYDIDEADEHNQELITEDDDYIMDFFVDDLTPSPTSSTSTTSPTIEPTFLSSFWEGLDGYEDSLPFGFHSDAYSDMYSDLDSEDYGENTILIKMSMGVIHAPDLSGQEVNDILAMALRTITNVLNDYSNVPFVAHDNIEHYDDRNRNLQTQTVDFGFGANVEAEEKPMHEIYLGDILLVDVITHQGRHDWYELWATYKVFKHSWRDTPDDRRQRKLELGEPVDNQAILTRIEGICNNAIMKSMADGLYWTALRNVDYGNPDLLLPKGIYYSDDKGIIDCKAVGDEYDLAPMYCPIDRPQYGNTKECPANPIEIGNASMPVESQDFGVPDNNMVHSVSSGSADPTYPDVIAESFSDIQWGSREWVGFALMISTVVWTLVLSVTAYVIFKRRKTQILWGTALTPNGVDDFLKVGWRVYEQPQQQQPSPEVDQPPPQHQPQLFLQIYDKGPGPGYNDENSILRGGVEQPLIFAAPPLQNRPENIQPP